MPSARGAAPAHNLASRMVPTSLSSGEWGWGGRSLKRGLIGNFQCEKNTQPRIVQYFISNVRKTHNQESSNVYSKYEVPIKRLPGKYVDLTTLLYHLKNNNNNTFQYCLKGWSWGRKLLGTWGLALTLECSRQRLVREGRASEWQRLSGVTCRTHESQACCECRGSVHMHRNELVKQCEHLFCGTWRAKSIRLESQSGFCLLSHKRDTQLSRKKL